MNKMSSISFWRDIHSCGLTKIIISLNDPSKHHCTVLTFTLGLSMYKKGLLLYRSISSSCLRTASRLAEDSTLISSRVMALEPWALVVTSKHWTSGRLFFRWRVPAGVSWNEDQNWISSSCFSGGRSSAWQCLCACLEGKRKKCAHPDSLSWYVEEEALFSKRIFCSLNLDRWYGKMLHSQK